MSYVHVGTARDCRQHSSVAPWTSGPFDAFKPDLFTSLGLWSDNQWGLKVRRDTTTPM